jgi:hypothetical protein
MASALATLLRLATITICLIVAASFALYAVNQTSTASAHQQESLASGGAVAPANTPEGQIDTTETHTTGVRGVIDEITNTVTSPFHGATASSNSEWAKRGANLGFTLLVYGFGLGFIARFVRVRTS